ncbi:TM0106 family RecB-like putative nuclease [Allosaccharopolyspora coralli]|uniref:TM0106 family RecB-like putative nuclease n=1 Tax=Allosaccharopolyspora coralli TaxID=2665642 RepID=A0A5Q3Q0S6_9PSEU|nr:TM0106 family RecB-like putative nuclease [Allosaccharopolyspora coralli]QGK68228.1 TM0106 family RecB-like putative nuclease [Allosaccharopolyspora coralli]
MDTEVLLDAGVVTRCRRRVHLEHDPAMRDADQAPPDPGVEQRIADATDHRRAVAERLGALFGEGWVRIPGDAGRRAREEATLTAMRREAAFVSQPQLPADEDGGRRGSIDLLVRVDDGYVPVLVVRHKTTDPGSGALTSPVPEAPTHSAAPLTPADAGTDAARKPRAQPRDVLRLAHATRMLQACGMSTSGRLRGGVIGVDADVVLWHDLDAGTWPGGRTALEEYDARFADRLAVATAAARGAEPLAHASRITDCKGCPWWPTCSADLRAARDVSLVVRGEDAALLRAAGVSTVDDLAALSGPEAEAAPLAATRTADAILLAKAWLHELPLVRRVREVEVPRGDVEVDIDMESYADDGAYMWGCWLSGVDTDEEHGYRDFTTWDPLPTDDEARSFAEFWTWLSAVRRRTHERGLTFRAYCYNELAENRWLLGSAERFAGKPGIPPLDEVREFIGSDEWVDLFASVRDQFLCPNGKGLKVIAPSAGFGWRDPEASGENSMRWYRDAVGLDGDAPQESQRQRLRTYNEDDVRATLAIRRWMSSDDVLRVPHADDL